MIKLVWSDFKNFINAHSLAISAIPQSDGYFLQSSDAVLNIECFIVSGTSDYTDFITNYL